MERASLDQMRFRAPAMRWLPVLFLSGCLTVLPLPDAGVDGGAADAGQSMDAGVDAGETDAGVDAGLADAGVDAGVPDAGQRDAGIDAGVPDAGQLDAGVDAGSLDAGHDAGVLDAGVIDAGLADAGLDAGFDAGVVDAGPQPACTGDSQCLSNRCVVDAGDCFNCQSDSECGFGRLCGSGVCSARCTTTNDCGGSAQCCAGRCVNLQVDVAHCGSCTVICGPDFFCGRGLCRPATFSQLCQMPTATVVLDGVPEDDDAGVALGDAIVPTCSPFVTNRVANEDDGGVIATTGEPIQLGELLIMGGGSFRQSAIRWLEGINRAEVNDVSTVSDHVYMLRDGGVVSSVPVAVLNETHDRVLIQLVRAPSGALVLNAAGYFATGTRAAADYFINVLAPIRASLTTRWYVLDWVDTDGSGAPSAGDTWTVVASG